MAKLKTIKDLSQKKNVLIVGVVAILIVFLIGKSIMETATAMTEKKKREHFIEEEKKIDIVERSIFDIDQTTAIKNAINNIKEEVKVELDATKNEQKQISEQIAENQKIILDQQAELIALKELNNQAEKFEDKKIDSEIKKLKKALEDQKNEFDKYKKVKETSENLKFKDFELPELKGPLKDAIIGDGSGNLAIDDEFATVNIEEPVIIPTKQNSFFKFDGKDLNETKEEKEEDEDSKDDSKSMDLMMGLVDAVMITGVDAPTNVGTRNSDAKDPLPVLLSVSSETLIANDYTQEYKDCLILGTATGNATTERAYIRLSKLSCVSKNGEKRIESEIEGWVMGEDNKIGVAGHLVTKSGSLILKGIMAGILQGIADSVRNTDSYIDTGGLSGNNRSFGRDAAGGMGTGVGSAFKALADFYIDMAKDLYPVVEVKGGRTIQILVKGGKKITESPYNKLFVNSDYEIDLDNTNISIEY